MRTSRLRVERVDAFMIRLAFLYLAIGVGILFVQFSNSPCRYPVVLDDGGPPIGPPLDIERIGTDRAYQWRLGKDVIFWLPRLVDLVGIRGMPFPDYIFGRLCKAEGAQPLGAETSPAMPGAGSATASAGPAMPPPVAGAPQGLTTLVTPAVAKPLAGYTPPTLGRHPAEPPIPPERPRP